MPEGVRVFESHGGIGESHAVPALVFLGLRGVPSADIEIAYIRTYRDKAG
jgi:hypothetical protein